MRKVTNKVTTLVISLIVALSLFAGQASAYTVKSGDTMKGIANSNGLTLQQLISYNPQIKNPNVISIGQNVNTSQAKTSASKVSVSTEDKDLMARLVRAEADGEPYAGQVAVAVVVLNRVASSGFPNTVHGVIYETYSNGKIPAFSPVANGEINKPADADAKRAVNEAITYQPNTNGSLFFYNPKLTSKDNWIRSREITIVIGNHNFAK
jgi:N-acetylmuramoyl-L-alanine amidase